MKLQTTGKWERWWQKRTNWTDGYSSPEAIRHPHRRVIVESLRLFDWVSLVEIGCATGPNLVNIVQNFPNKQIGGIDINPEAIEIAQKTFVGGMFKVCSADDIMLSDKATDVSLTDMTLIYVSPRKILKYLAEMKRITRNHVVLCEFNSKSFWKRLWLRITEGYFAHDYRKLLESLGFRDILEYKLTDADWPDPDGKGHEPQKTFASVFVARVPKRG